MPRVRSNINQLREIWSAKSNRSRSFSTPTKPTIVSRPSDDRGPSDTGSNIDLETETARKVLPSAMDHCLSIHTWLAQHNIDIGAHDREAIVNTSDVIAVAENSNASHYLDNLLNSLENTEHNMEDDLRTLLPINKAIQTPEVCKSAVPSTDGLVDYFVIIGPDATDLILGSMHSNQGTILEPSILFTYPPQHQFSAQSLEHFCFPSGIKTSEIEKSSEHPKSEEDSNCEQFYVLILSGSGALGQNVQYACCIETLLPIKLPNSGLLKKVPVCYCAVTQLPLLSFFNDILLKIARLHAEDCQTRQVEHLLSVVSDEYLELLCETLQILVHTAPPSTKIPLHKYFFRDRSDSFTLARPFVDDLFDEAATSLLHWGLPTLLSCLGVDMIVDMMGYLLAEINLIVLCNDRTRLSSCILSLSSLLWPLKWAGPIVVSLPSFLAEYMDAPVPMLCGVDRLPKAFSPPSHTAIVYLDRRTIQLCKKPSMPYILMSEASISAQLRSDLHYIAAHIHLQASNIREYSIKSAVDVFGRRIRLQIQEWIQLCDNNLHEANRDANFSIFLSVLQQTQMFQRYKDDSANIKCADAEGFSENALLRYSPINLSKATADMFKMALF